MTGFVVQGHMLKMSLFLSIQFKYNPMWFGQVWNVMSVRTFFRINYYFKSTREIDTRVYFTQ